MDATKLFRPMLAVIDILYLGVIVPLLLLSLCMFVAGILTFFGKAEVSQRVRLTGIAALVMGVAMLFASAALLLIAALVFRQSLR